MPGGGLHTLRERSVKHEVYIFLPLMDYNRTREICVAMPARMFSEPVADYAIARPAE